MALRTLTPILVFAVGVYSYTPPLGIPEPPFGIDETVGSVYGDGYCTHYVDNTHPLADNANGNGTPTAPLMDPFRGANSVTLPAGSVMEIHGGPYRWDGWKQILAEGTAAQPVIVRGIDPVNRVRIESGDGSHDWRIQGSHLILENIDFVAGAFLRLYEMPDHVAFRNVEIHAEGITVDIGAGVSGGGTDIVVYNSHIHDLWRGADVDCHGIVPGPGSLRYWILENHIHGNSGDGIQACHQCSPPPRYVYIGGNVIHDDRENAVDLKYADDVVISRNTCYGYENASTSDGVAIVIGSDGAPMRPWVVGNTIYQSARGVRIEEVGEAWIVGNVIHSIADGAIMLEKQGTNLHIVSNTVCDADVFIDQYWQTAFGLDVQNNVLANMRGQQYACHMNIESNTVYAAATFRNNLFYQSGGEVILNLGDGGNQADFDHFSSTADFGALPFGTGNLLQDPLFTSATTFDFSLQNSSPAIDKGAVHGLFGVFDSLHGESIRFDMFGVARPQELGWDIGAYEHTGPGAVHSGRANAAGAQRFAVRRPVHGEVLTVAFALRTLSGVDLTVFDLSGERVATLAAGQLGAGAHCVPWNTRGCAAGVYMVRMRSGGCEVAHAVRVSR